MGQSKIQILPDDLANQIAAGEVVERPSSAVKELLENALDAGAKRVAVDIEEGGRKLLRVSDDGCGMSREDALLAVKRHATSKIRSVEDLHAIRTLGFRGEALPSIASVSRFRLITREAEQVAATSVEFDGGGPPRITEQGAPVGTTVEVRELFFNIPARLKFLRTAATELGHVSHLVDCFALGHPQVHFRLTHNGKLVSEYPSETQLRQRVYAVLGRDVSRRLFEVYLDGEALVSGFVSEPTLNRSAPQQLYTFVNARYVRDKLLYRAVVNAYGGLLDRGRYPIGVLFVDVEPDEVDVNVHPTKSEVRFVRSSAVFQTLSRAVQLTLSTSPWKALPVGAPAAEAAETAEPAPTPYQIGHDPDGGELADSTTARLPHLHDAALPKAAAPPGDPWSPSVPPEPRGPRPAFSSPPGDGAHQGQQGPGAARFAPQTPTARPVAQHLTFGEPVARTPAEPPASSGAEPGRLAQSAHPAHPMRPGDGQYFRRLYYVGQMRRTFLVCQSASEMVLIDQHAADERYHYERLRATYAKAGLRPQPLLFAELLEVDALAVSTVESQRDELLRMGLEISVTGPRTLALKAVPDLLIGKPYVQTVRDVLSELASGGSARALEDRADHIFATMACHAAIRAGDPLSFDEAKALLARMDETPYAANCPHGRPVLVVTPFTEVERWFHRR